MGSAWRISAASFALVLAAAGAACSGNSNGDDGAGGGSSAADLALNQAWFAARHSEAELAASRAPIEARTQVEIRGDAFYINGRPTYEGRVWRGHKIEGLLMNSRMVLGVFDDINPSTRAGWSYADTGVWDPERNTDEFVAAMPSWRAHGLLAFTINLQGGNAHGANEQWVNTALGPHGELHSAYFRRLRKIIVEADRLGMVVILGLYYFRNDEALSSDEAIRTGVDNTINWLHDIGARNVLIEIDNECDIPSYDFAVLRCDRAPELMAQVRNNVRNGYRYPVSVSLQGGALPSRAILEASDFVLLHGNAVSEPSGVTDMLERVRSMAGWRAMPVIFNEDDHAGFENADNNFVRAVSGYASWGFLDNREPDAPLTDGFQTPPVDWTISSPRKRAFFGLVREITAGE